MSKILEASGERQTERLKDDLKRIVQGLEPEEQKEDDEFERLAEKAGRVARKAFAKYRDYINRAFVRVQLQFAQEMGIKLYTSTNFRSFQSLPDQLLTPSSHTST